jgi:hypothetical protein
MDRHQGRTGTYCTVQTETGARTGAGTRTCSFLTATGQTVLTSVGCTRSLPGHAPGLLSQHTPLLTSARRLCVFHVPPAVPAGGGGMMAAIQAGLGGLRKTSVGGGPAGGAAPGSGVRSPSAAASPARTCNAPSSAAKSPVTSPSSANGSTQPAAAARPSFGSPRAAVVTTPAATAAKPAAAAVAPKPAAPVKKANPEDSGWQELQTPEGVPYYHNKITNVTTWSVGTRSASAVSAAGDVMTECEARMPVLAIGVRSEPPLTPWHSMFGTRADNWQDLHSLSHGVSCLLVALFSLQGQARRVEDRC